MTKDFFKLKNLNFQAHSSQKPQACLFIHLHFFTCRGILFLKVIDLTASIGTSREFGNPKMPKNALALTYIFV